MKCHKCTNLVKDYNATKTDKTFLYECLKKNRWSVNSKDLKNGLGEMKPYYCKGDYIWSDGNGNISSKSRQEFKNGDTHHYDRWIKEIKNYVDNDDFEYNEEFIIKLCLSYTLQSLRNGENLKRFQWDNNKRFEVLSGGFDENGNPLYQIKDYDRNLLKEFVLFYKEFDGYENSSELRESELDLIDLFLGERYG